MLVFILQSSHVEILEMSPVFISSLCQKLCLHFFHTLETIILSLPKNPVRPPESDYIQSNNRSTTSMTTVASVKLLAINLQDINHTTTNLYVRQHWYIVGRFIHILFDILSSITLYSCLKLA